jgi:hypothetical protein
MASSRTRDMAYIALFVVLITIGAKIVIPFPVCPFTLLLLFTTIARRELEGYHNDRVADTRVMGGCIAFEARKGEDIDGFQDFAYKRGVFARTFLGIQYAMPPYIITEQELVHVINTMKEWWE